MEINTGLIIQARTGSTRLSKKIIRTIDGQTTFLDVLLSRLAHLNTTFPLILATTQKSEDDILLEYGSKYQIPVFRGSELNVLQRFIDCAEAFGLHTIVRICSDNPFIDLQAITELKAEYRGEDYLSYRVNGLPAILTHYGFFTEIVSLQALQRVFESGEAGCQEHVTNCIYTDEHLYSVRFIHKTISNQRIRCTLDTEEDMENLRRIYLYWYKKLENVNFRYQDLIDYIESQPDLALKMQRQIQNNPK